MAIVAILLRRTGALTGVIENTRIDDVLIHAIDNLVLPEFALAHLSALFMPAATVAATAGATVASNVYAATILDTGVAALGGAMMIHAGSTVLDHMPHGSFFHATAGSVAMHVQERLKLIPYETIVGFV